MYSKSKKGWEGCVAEREGRSAKVKSGSLYKGGCLADLGVDMKLILQRSLKIGQEIVD